MKIKDCLACKMAEENVVSFITDIIPYLIVYESWNDSMEGWYDDAINYPEDASFSKDFLDHMSMEHSKEVDDLCTASCVKIHNLAKGVF